MNEVLKSKLNIIADDDLLLKCLKAVFDERTEKERPTVENTDDNVLIGEKYRAYESAKYIIDLAFKDLNNYKVGTKTDIKQNRGK